MQYPRAQDATYVSTPNQPARSLLDQAHSSPVLLIRLSLLREGQVTSVQASRPSVGSSHPPSPRPLLCPPPLRLAPWPFLSLVCVPRLPSPSPRWLSLPPSPGLVSLSVCLSRFQSLALSVNRSVGSVGSGRVGIRYPLLTQ